MAEQQKCKVAKKENTQNYTCRYYGTGTAYFEIVNFIWIHGDVLSSRKACFYFCSFKHICFPKEESTPWLTDPLTLRCVGNVCVYLCRWVRLGAWGLPEDGGLACAESGRQSAEMWVQFMVRRPSSCSSSGPQRLGSDRSTRLFESFWTKWNRTKGEEKSESTVCFKNIIMFSWWYFMVSKTPVGLGL